MALLTIPILITGALMWTPFFLAAMFGPIYNANRSKSGSHTHERSTRDVVEEHGNLDDVMQLINGKCVDKAPNCNQDLCQKQHISFWKKCRKTCGACDPMIKMIEGIKKQSNLYWLTIDDKAIKKSL